MWSSVTATRQTLQPIDCEPQRQFTQLHHKSLLREIKSKKCFSFLLQMLHTFVATFEQTNKLKVKKQKAIVVFVRN